MIEHICASENSTTADLVMEIVLEFILQFLGFLGASKVPSTSINRLVNRKKDTEALRKELTTLQGSKEAFLGLFFPFYYEDVYHQTYV
jgi:hypothetical protein